MLKLKGINLNRKIWIYKNNKIYNKKANVRIYLREFGKNDNERRR